MKITLKARFIVTASAIILAIANFLAYRVLVFSSTLPDSNFLIFNIVSLAIFIVIVNILFIPEIKHYKFDLDKIKE
ncbi:MAG: hypothetical protein JXR64_11455, partial [Spirochaetales bacterium]|nr:hypothetical protein [Spirochaetales bacterium]